MKVKVGGAWTPLLHPSQEAHGEALRQFRGKSLFTTARQSSSLINFECKFKVDWFLFFDALRQNLMKIDKPNFNEKNGFLGCLLADKVLDKS